MYTLWKVQYPSLSNFTLHEIHTNTQPSAVWTRFFPVTKALQSLLHSEKVLGKIYRVFVDFGLDMPLSSLPATARTADPTLGAGALLDIGIYTLTWADVILSPLVASAAPKVVSALSMVGGVDEMATVVLNYEASGIQAICTSSMRNKSDETFCRIEGEKGVILVGEPAASKPGWLEVNINGEKAQRTDFDVAGWGFHFEADAVGADLRAGRKESEVVPLGTTRSVMALMDEVRRQNGFRYKQDEE